MSANTSPKNNDPHGFDVELQNTICCLEKKVRQTNWFRYTLRRIPLYSFAGLFFYLTCFLMSTVKEIGFSNINLFLKQLPISNLELVSFNILLGLFSLSIIGLIIEGIVYHSYNHDAKYYSMPACYKIFVNFFLITVFISLFIMVLNSNHPLLLGLAIFSTSTVSALLLDKTLGYTKRNERYRLFANRAKYMLNSIEFKKQFGSNICEEQNNEVDKFYHDLWNTKHDNTVSDTSYLLKKLESIKSAINIK